MSNFLPRKVHRLIANIIQKGFFHLLSANILISFIGFSSQLFVAKFLSPIDLGRIKTMQAFVSVAILIAGFGFNTAVVKLCSEQRPLQDKEAILKLNIRLTWRATIITLAVMTALALGGFFSPDPVINHWILVLMLSIPTAVVTSLIIAYFQALKKIQLMSYVQAGIRIIGVVAIIALTYFWRMPGFIIATVLVGLVAIFPLLCMTKIKWTSAVRKVNDAKKMSVHYGKWSFAANSLNTFGFSLDIFLLNYIIKDRAVLGDYGFATVFILALNQITGTVQAIAIPFFSEKSKERLEFMRVFRKYQRLLILLASGVAIIAIFAVPWFIRLVYGDKYKTSGFFFQILVIRYFFWSCYALISVALIGLGRMKDNFKVSILIIPTLFVSSVFFILLWGPVGAAWGQAMGGIVALNISYIIFSKIIKQHHFSEVR